jgi:chaperonin GroES
MAGFRPLYDRVLVLRKDAEEVSKGGIVIPDSAKEKPAEGVIVAVGTGRVLEDGKVRPLEVKDGDRILFGKYAGSETTVEGKTYTILREDEILGILT